MLKILILWNVIVFAAYGIDKLKAVCGGWRISEKALLTMAFLMGGVGAYLGMLAFRHKTRKPLFRISVPIAILLNILIIYYCTKRGWF